MDKTAGPLDAVLASVDKLMSLRRNVIAGKATTQQFERAMQAELLRQSYEARGEVYSAVPGIQTAIGRMDVVVKYRQGDGYWVPMVWDFIPDAIAPGYHSVLGLCPACYHLAPTTVDWKTGSAPVVVDQTMMMRKGNAEADRKLRIWRYDGYDVLIEWKNDQALLTVGSVIKCLGYKSCNWSVRVERGRAHWVSTGGILRPGAPKGTGSIVKPGQAPVGGKIVLP